MKKMLRRIIVLVCIATLCLMPASTALAASTPVLYFDIPGVVKYFMFQPAQIVYNDGSVTALSDTTASNGSWFATANKPFKFQINSTSNIPLHVYIFSDNNTKLVYNNEENGVGLIEIILDAQPTDKNYNVYVFVPYSETTIYGYGVVYQ